MTNLANSSGKFQYLKPCPLCGSNDGRCRRKGNLWLCMSYVNGEGASENWKYLGSTKDRCWGIYCLRGEEDNWKVKPQGFIRESRDRERPERTRTRAQKHKYFQWLLGAAPLNNKDRETLIKKGLRDSEINPGIFGSCYGGFLIVLPDVFGNKVAAQIRRREASEGGRYYWHISKKHPHNQLENGQTPIAVWRNIQSDNNILNICEGYLKSYIARCQYARLGQNHPWIGVGAASYLNSGLEEIKRTIKILNPQIVRFYPDGGSAINPNVSEHYQRFWQQLRRNFPTLKIEVASWNQEFSKGQPDLDELEDKSKIQFIPLKEYEIRFQQREPYRQEERLSVWKQKLATHRYILDSSPTGTGKSHSAGEFDEPAIYLSTDHRNPDVASLQKWQDVEARHGGLCYKNGYLRRAENPQEAHIPSNCELHQSHQKLREQGHESGFLCLKCRHFERCQKESGPGYGYLHQRKLALAAKQIRIHPDSLPRIDKFDYQQRTIIIEEASEIPMVQRLIVSKNQVLKAITLINESPAIPTETKIALSQWLQTIAEALEKHRGTKHGISNDIKPPEISTSTQLSLWELADPSAELKDEDEIAPQEWGSATRQERQQLARANAMLKKYTADAEWIRKTLSNKLSLGILWLILGHSSWISPQETLQVYKVKNELRQIIKQAKNVLFLDATASPEKIALIYGIPVDQIHEISCIMENEQNNLSIEQISDLGKLCRQRGRNQCNRLKTLIQAYKDQEPDTRVIDLLQHTEDSCWWRDSRGRNSFTTCKQLLLVGLPARNLLHCLSEFSELGGTLNAFQKYYKDLIQSDILQGIGRLRSHRRPNEQLKVVIITNFPLTKIATKQIKSTQITQGAAPKIEQKVRRIVEIYQELEKNNVKPTQAAIAKQLSIARETVCRCWQKVKEALQEIKQPPVRICQNTEAEEQALGIIETVEEFQEYSPKEQRKLLLHILNEIPTNCDNLGRKILLKIYEIKGLQWLLKLENLIDSS